jgi:hypothetical protein
VKFKQNIVSARFLEVLDELISKGSVESVAAFCKLIDYSKASMSQLKSGKRDVTIELVSKLLTEFRGNPIYIFTGKGSKILNDYTLSIVEDEKATYGEGGDDRKTIKVLEELIASKNDNITMLKERVADLQKQLNKISK